MLCSQTFFPLSSISSVGEEERNPPRLVFCFGDGREERVKDRISIGASEGGSGWIDVVGSDMLSDVTVCARWVGEMAI